MKGILGKVRVMSVSAMALLVMALSSSALYAQTGNDGPHKVEFEALLDVSSLFTSITPWIASIVAGCLIIGLGVLLAMKIKGYFARTV